MNDIEAAQSFNSVFTRYGGPLDSSGLHSSVNAGFEEFLMWYRSILKDSRYSTHPHLPRGNIYCDFVDNNLFNAAATTHNGYELIGVFAGAIFLIYRYFLCFFADPSTVTLVGDVSTESSDSQTLNALRNPLTSLQTAAQHPRDPERLRAAQNLAWNASIFLFGHECSHITRGHLALLQGELGVDTYIEMPAVPISAHQAAIRRALELDADEGAARANFEMWSGMYTANAFPALAPLGLGRSWSISVAMLYHIMDALHPAGIAPDNMTHPSPFTRWTYVLYLANDAKAFPVAIDSQDLITGAQEVSQWWKRNSFPHGPRHSADPVQELTTLKNDLKRLWPRLLQYSQARVAAMKKQKSDTEG